MDDGDHRAAARRDGRLEDDRWGRQKRRRRQLRADRSGSDARQRSDGRRRRVNRGERRGRSPRRGQESGARRPRAVQAADRDPRRGDRRLPRKRAGRRDSVERAIACNVALPHLRARKGSSMANTVERRDQEGLVEQASAQVQEAASTTQERAVELKEQGKSKLGETLDQRTNDAGVQARKIAQALRRSGEQLSNEGDAEQVAGLAASRFLKASSERRYGGSVQAGGGSSRYGYGALPQATGGRSADEPLARESYGASG